MSLFYRAMWEDDCDDIIAVAEAAFREWVFTKTGITIGDEAAATFGDGSHAQVVHAADDLGRIWRASYHREDAGAWWKTQLTAFQADGEPSGWVWTDVEYAATDPYADMNLRAPEIARSLLGGGTNARLGPVRLSLEPFRTTSVDDLVELMTSDDRHIPVVIVAERKGRATSLEAVATSAARISAGITAVHLVSGDTVGRFNDHQKLPADYGVLPGTVRVFMPLRSEPRPDTDLVLSERELAAAAADEVGYRITRHIGERLASRRPPELYLQLRKTLYAALKRQGDFVALADDWLKECEARIQELDTENRELRAKLVALETGRRSDVAEHDEAVPEVSTTTEAIEWARRNCANLVIPDSAPRDIDNLDQDKKRATWATDILTGLRALDSYAARANDFNGGFRKWCEATPSGGVPWNKDKFAAKESETVSTNEKCRNARTFEVDERVDPSGTRFMQSHLKIQPGGPQNIPRVYFEDDTKGKTHKVHIGFIGPHYLVPNDSQ